MPKKNRIPDNWVDVAKMGTRVGSSRFLALRVPLDDKYMPQFNNKTDEMWSPKDFLAAQQEQKLDVKMIIDLTNTLKYYDGAEEFKDSGVQYVKLKIEGFKGPPAARDVTRFMEIVDELVEKEPEGAIAVHCTHGLNRTGYLIVTYMVKRLGCTVTEALEAFKAARPPGLIKHMYVEDLYKRLGEGEEMQLPELPDWATAKYGSRSEEHGGNSRSRERKRGGNARSKERKRGGRARNKDGTRDGRERSKEDRPARDERRKESTLDGRGNTRSDGSAEHTRFEA
jgi:atypical dual specificity phosphatase